MAGKCGGVWCWLVIVGLRLVVVVVVVVGRRGGLLLLGRRRIGSRSGRWLFDGLGI